VLPHVRYAAAEPLATAVIYAQGRTLSPAAWWLIGKIEQVLLRNAGGADESPS
jgi:hypothetical protein